MGKSNSIEQQAKLNAEFQAYVDQMRQDLDKSAEKQSKVLADRIEARYRNYGDDSSLISSSYQHLTTVSEWSLASVNQMIDTCRKAIFGGKLPDGAKQDTPKPDVSAAIKAMSNLDLLISNAAFDAVQSLLTSAGSRTETSINIKTDEKILAPGMTLFITVMDNSYRRKDFFRNDTILQTLFMFDVRFSIKEGQAVSKLSDLQSYEDQKQVMRNKLKQINDAVDKLDPTLIEDRQNILMYAGISDDLNKRLKKLNSKIQEIAQTAGALNNSRPALLEDESIQFDSDAIANRIQGIASKALAHAY